MWKPMSAPRSRNGEQGTLSVEGGIKVVTKAAK